MKSPSVILFRSVIISTVFFMLFTSVYPAYAEWEYVESGVDKDLMDVCFVDMLHGWAVGDSSTIIATNDGGITWHKQTSLTDTIDFRRVCFVNENVGYIVGSYGTILYTRDGGEIWNASESGIDNNCHISDVSFINEYEGWVSCYIGKGGIILHTQDGGITWETQLNNVCRIDAVKFIDKNNGWALGGPHIDNWDFTDVYRTTDGGEHWNIISEIQLPWMSKISIVAPDTIWVCYPYFASSFNGGLDWEEYFPLLLDICQIDGKNGWAVTYSGSRPDLISTIFSTEDAGTTWKEELVQNKFIFRAITNIGRDFICAVGESGGIVINRGIATKVDSTQNNMLKPFHLNDNFPNPFNASTTISFELHEPSWVNLQIYNIAGQKVTTLVDELMPAGNSRVLFDGINLPSGLYFYRFESPGFEKKGKMLLVK